MRGRLSIVDLAGVRPLVPDLIRSRVAPTAYVEGTTPKEHPIRKSRMNFADRKALQVTERWIPRRWNAALSDDLVPLETRVAIDQELSMPGFVSSIPYVKPGAYQINTSTPSYAQAAPAPAPDFWSSLGSGLSRAVSGVLPGLVQLQTAKVLNKQGAAVYTPAATNTLYQQAQYEAAQRQIEQGRQLGTTSMPLSTTALAVLGVGGLVLYLAMRKKGN